MKSLALLRHAKSSWADTQLTDIERPLNQRGRNAARQIAEVLRLRGHSFDIILASTAKRAQETADIFCAIACPESERRDIAGLYMASTHDIIALARGIDDRFDHALLIGHNPGFHSTALAFAESDNGNKWAKMQQKFPTAAFAGFAFDIGKWKNLNRGDGELHTYLTPKSLNELF